MANYRLYLDDELYHHGVQGQKWGTRRYQNEDGSLTEEGKIHYYGDHNGRANVDGSARSFDRQLNKGDKVMAKAQYRMARSEYKTNRLKDKLTNGYDQAKDKKTNKKIEAEQAKLNEAKKVYEYGQKRTNDLIKEASKSGYTVNSSKMYRWTTAGRDIAVNLVAGLPANMAVDAIGAYQAYKTGDERLTGVVSGTKYNVNRK